MTLDEIEKDTRECLIPKDIADVLGCNPYTITLQVRQDKERGVNSFPFPTILIGTRVKIPRRAFLAVMKGVKENDSE